MEKEHKTGYAVDPKGGAVIDPTKNVLDLVSAEVKRLNDLSHAETQRINDVLNLTSKYEEKLREAETERINAIRSVDVNAVAVAAERAAAQATVLANQVSQSAETLRALVATTAANIATQLSTLTSQLTDRISALEKSQYTISGTSGATTPILDAKFDSLNKAIAASMKEIESLRDSRNQTEGKGMGNRELIAYVIAAIGIIGFVLTLFSKLNVTP